MSFLRSCVTMISKGMSWALFYTLSVQIAPMRTWEFWRGSSQRFKTPTKINSWQSSAIYFNTTSASMASIFGEALICTISILTSLKREFTTILQYLRQNLSQLSQDWLLALLFQCFNWFQALERWFTQQVGRFKVSFWFWATVLCKSCAIVNLNSELIRMSKIRILWD